MIKFLIVFIFFISLETSFADTALDANKADLDRQKTELEIEKLNLDISASQEESTRKYISLASVIVGSLLGLGTLIWTVYQGVQTFKSKSEENRISRVSSLLENISSNDINLRIGAIRGLSQYSSYAIQELLSAASTESHAVVCTNIEDAIEKIDKANHLDVISANSQSVLKRIQNSGKLKGLGHDVSISESHLSEYKFIRKYFNDTFEHGFILGKLYGSKHNEENAIDVQKKQLLEVLKNESRLAKVTSSVISNWIRSGKLGPLTVESLDLSESNLYKAIFPVIKSNCFVAPFSLMRHSQLRYSTIENGVFDHSDLLDADLSNSSFFNTSFLNSHLRKAKGKNVKFNNCNFHGTVMSQGDYSGSSFNETNCKKTKFRNAILTKTVFSNSILNEAEFQEANLIDATLSGEKLFGANLINADLTRATAKNCKFNGADLRGVVFKNADLSGSDFSGANISGANFEGADLEDVDLSKAKSLDRALNVV